MNRSTKLSSNSYEDMKILKELNEEKVIEILAQGPSEEEYKKNNIINKNITLECLKMGDIFPAYYTANSNYLDVSYYAESPCDVIILRLTDLQETLPVNI
jgi:hypothetical protein